MWKSSDWERVIAGNSRGLLQPWELNISAPALGYQLSPRDCIGISKPTQENSAAETLTQLILPYKISFIWVSLYVL